MMVTLPFTLFLCIMVLGLLPKTQYLTYILPAYDNYAKAVPYDVVECH